MRVKELIAELSKLDQNLEVVAYVEDDEGYDVFEIDNASITLTKTDRGPDGKVRFTFDSGPGSRKIVYVNLIKEF